jgi:hypothetical protein
MAARKPGKLVVVGIAFVFAAAALVAFERIRGSRALGEVLEQLRTSQVELDPAKLLTNSVPDSENSAVALLQISDRLQSFYLPAEVGAIPLMKLEEPGVAVSVIRAKSWTGSDGEIYRWNQLDQAHNEALVLFEAIAEIAKRPRFASALDASKGVADMELRALSVLPSIMRVLRLVAAYDLHHGNDERAAQAVIALLDSFPNKSEDTWNIAEMVRWSFARLGMSLTWELLQHANLSDESWRSLQTAWEKCDFLGFYAKAAQMEIAGVSDYFVRLKASADYQENILGKFEQLERDYGASWRPIFRGQALRQVNLPLWRMLWADQDHAYSLRNRATELDLAQFARSHSWERTQHEAFDRGRRNGEMDGAEMQERSVYDRARYLFSLSPEPISRVDLLRAFQAETEACFAVATIALRRYFGEHSKYPERIEELVPRYVRSVPKDPMEGGTLKYRPLNDGGYLLYSSGVDGEDDGGESGTAGSANRLNFWNTMDVIWPQRKPSGANN